MLEGGAFKMYNRKFLGLSNISVWFKFSTLIALNFVSFCCFSQISLGDSLFAIGDTNYYQNDYSRAISLYKKANLAYEQVKDSAKSSRALNDIGLSFKKIGEFDSAQHYYELALLLDIQRKDSLGIIGKHRNISNLYVERGNYLQASRLLLKAREIAETNNYEKAIGGLNNSLGSLYLNQEDYLGALSYYKLAKRSYQILGDSIRLGIALNNLGNCYSNLVQWDSAFYFLREALAVKEKSSKLNSIAYTLHNLGSLFYRVAQYDSAEIYLLQAYEIRQEISDQHGMAWTSNELGKLYIKLERSKQAHNYLKESYQYAVEKKHQKILIENTKLFRDYYLQIGDMERAFEKSNTWAILRDSAFSQEKLKVLKLQSDFELKRKEEERQQQEKEALNQSRIAEQRLLIIGGVTAAALILVALVLYVIRQRSKIKVLNENLKLVNRDMYHRKKNDYMRLLNEISATNVTISEDIRGQLLASAAVDESLYEEAYDMVDLDDYLDERLEDIADAQGLNAKEVALKTELDRVRISGQRATAILLVLNELMTNSAKHSFADRGGIIHIAISGESGHLKVTYKDDGAPFVPKAKSNAGMGQKIIEQVLKTLRTELNREVQGQWNQSSFVIKV